MYYQNHTMNFSRELALDTISDCAGTATGTQTTHRMDSLDSHDSISRYVTYSTVVLLSAGKTEVRDDGRGAG